MDSPLYAAWLAGSREIKGHPVLEIPSGAQQVISGPVNMAHDTSDPGASNVEVFEIPENHVYAASSILFKCAVDTNFSPSETTNIPPDVLSAYVARVSRLATGVEDGGGLERETTTVALASILSHTMVIFNISKAPRYCNTDETY